MMEACHFRTPYQVRTDRGPGPEHDNKWSFKNIAAVRRDWDSLEAQKGNARWVQR